jgi:hypothetical protein
MKMAYTRLLRSILFRMPIQAPLLPGFCSQFKERPQTARYIQVFLEVNQTWDWNEYWTNDKFPDDPEYSTSCQPSLVYEAALDAGMPDKTVIMKPIGHGHYSGKDGSLNSDLSTLTTALRIAGQISVRLLP